MLTPQIRNFIFRSLTRRHFSSALYITGAKAQTNFALLTPVIDFDEKIENKQKLQHDISARHLDVDLDKLIDKWNLLHLIQERKDTLEHTKSEIIRLSSELSKDSEHNKEDIEKLKVHFKIVKEDLNNIKTFYYDVEEDTMINILNLPNELREETPLDEEKVIHTFLERPHGTTESHVEIGSIKGFIKYIDPLTCFFKSEASLFELCLLNYFRDNLEKCDYFPLICPNFCKSIIAEGCGEEPSKLFSIEDEESIGKVNKLHLCGGSSLFSFMAFFTKLGVHQRILPIKCFSVGKKFQPYSSASPKSLLSLSQQSSVSFFIASSDEEDQLETVIEQVKTFYDGLGFHYRLSCLPANQLGKSESFHLSIQMFSNYLSEYVEVGNVSSYGSYLSKRLLFCYTENKQRMYPRVISGTLVNVPRVLGCLLENQSLSGDDLLNDSLKRYL